MEIKITDEHANPLLKRREYHFEIAHATAATPTREQVRAELAKIFNAPKDRVIVERMNARFGTAVTRGEARVYESAEVAKTITREHILVRNKLKEKPQKGTPAAAPAAPEAPKAEPEKAPAEPKKE
ncbi:MAG TPA: 30S ribosomal protein S24e [Thermoplasmata archaeon]|nr:30S ribosomal protein S24e [Thermoplasmata archaeon]